VGKGNNHTGGGGETKVSKIRLGPGEKMTHSFLGKNGGVKKNEGEDRAEKG